jgi:coenzyme Q-binding protein COQ10
MPVLDFERTVPFSPAQMLSLIGDLETYPDFVPHCSGMQVSRAGDADGAHVRLARMAVRFGPINQAYTSRVTLNEDAGTVRAEAVDGPFSHLDSCWQVFALESGARVRFSIDFDFSNRLIAAVANAAFAAKQVEIVDAFIDEAYRRFRPSGPAPQ